MKQGRGGEAIPIDDRRLVLVANPRATRIRYDAALHSQLDQLPHFFADTRHVITTPDLETDIDYLRNNVLPDDIVCVIGGDGTQGKVASALAVKELQDQGIVMAAIPGGNKNDFARSVNGHKQLIDYIYEGLNRGAVPAYLLAAQITSPGQPTVHHRAIQSLSFGISAHIASAVNLPKYRESSGRKDPIHRFLDESAIVLEAIKQRSPFSFQDAAGQLQSRYELTFGNTPSLGGYGILPLEPAESMAYILEAPPSLPASLSMLARLITGTLPRDREYYLSPDETYTFELQSNNVRAQFDGEAMKAGQPYIYHTGTEITVGLHDHPVHVLKTTN